MVELQRTKFLDNQTPTWQKGDRDGITNMVALGLVATSFMALIKGYGDMITDTNKIEGR